MVHQNPPYLAFRTPGQNEIKNKIQGYQRETKKTSTKVIHITAKNIIKLVINNNVYIKENT